MLDNREILASQVILLGIRNFCHLIYLDTMLLVNLIKHIVIRRVSLNNVCSHPFCKGVLLPQLVMYV